MPTFLPAKRSFHWWRGGTFRYAFEWLDNDGKTTLPHDLTEYTGLCVLEPARNEPGTPLTLTHENGGILFGGPSDEPDTGIVELYISKAQFEAVEWKKATYTLFVAEPSAPEDDYSLLTGFFVEAGPPH